MPPNGDSTYKIPPVQPPAASDRIGAEREISDLKYPSKENYSALSERVVALENQIPHLATCKDLEKVKTWTMTMRHSGLVYLAAAIGSAITILLASLLRQ